MNVISSNINKRRSFYNNKLKTFISWSTKRCSMNGTSDKYIRNMLTQICKELNISSVNIPGFINKLYSRDFDASSLVNKVYTYSQHKFDIFSKDEMIRNLSIESAINSLNDLNIHTSVDTKQLTGMCIFVHFVLMGGRNDLEGFGVSPDLIEKWKKNQQKIKKNQAEENRKQQLIEIEKLNKMSSNIDDEEKEEKLVQENVPDSWEDF